MEITWYGNSCFRITERNKATVVTDPFDAGMAGYNPLKLKSEIVTTSSNDLSHNNINVVKGSPFVIDGPGEYERGGVFITGIQTTPLMPKNKELRNTIYVFDYGAITILHLGQINSVPNQTMVEELGNINIALVPVGSGGGLNASKAAEVISMLEPNIVIPMHYETLYSKLELDPLSKFLKEMGLTELETMETYKIPTSGGFGEEGTQVIALDPKLSS
ncbi:MAG: MBL fold metallo-hydrolase [Chloroflexi bacterium]|nr:MBL fold metallo-hydrolase [Chloroflexota bacterium]